MTVAAIPAFAQDDHADLTTRSNPVGVCNSPSDPAIQALAARLSQSMSAAYRTRRVNWIGVQVTDRATGISCGISQHRRTEVASVDKVAIVASLLYKHQRAGQSRLRGAERSWARAAIMQSDNDAAGKLFHAAGGQPGLARFEHAARMIETRLDPSGYWGDTRSSAVGQVSLMQALTSDSVLHAPQRNYLLGLMRHVSGDQRWGIGAGARGASVIAIKDGWGTRPRRSWRVNSIGNVHNRSHDYNIALMSDGNPTEQYGIRTISAIARSINSVLR